MNARITQQATPLKGEINMAFEKPTNWTKRLRNLVTLVTGMLFLLMQTQNAMAAVHYVHTDHLGTPVMVTDQNRTVIWKAEHEPYGKTTINTETIKNNVRFPGQLYDSETGYFQNWNRDYDPTLGRYLQSDPIGLNGGINTYVYVSGNPVRYIDPQGLAQQCQIGISTTGGYNVGPFHHDYQCWKGSDGQLVCRGFSFDDANGSPSLFDKVTGPIPGKVLKDGENRKDGKEEQCTADDHNKCMDECLASAWGGEEQFPSSYGLMGGETCQSVARRHWQNCSAKCSKN